MKIANKFPGKDISIEDIIKQIIDNLKFSNKSHDNQSFYQGL